MVYLVMSHEPLCLFEARGFAFGKICTHSWLLFVYLNVVASACVKIFLANIHREEIRMSFLYAFKVENAISWPYIPSVFLISVDAIKVFTFYVLLQVRGDKWQYVMIQESEILWLSWCDDMIKHPVECCSMGGTAIEYLMQVHLVDKHGDRDVFGMCFLADLSNDIAIFLLC